MKINDITHSGNGDINILENNNIPVPKLLKQCSNDELLEEIEFRKKMLSKERMQTKNKYKPIIYISAAIFIFGFIWGTYEVRDITNILNWLYALPGAILGIVSLVQMSEPSKFEKKHISALNECKDLLRERGYPNF